uniref:Small ribosomal subunit protein uS4c n=1 Tax=Stichococcus bacillaris TaxID=37433 RepID=A0A097KKI8_9CHLO|nr:ribosomal protein S4 [Stichococcus bacillaris]AIT93699.1 ribosomal protein S4 [Stichococcus bacillaris]
MSRYRGPKLKIVRRLGQDLPGFTKKQYLESKKRKTKLSEYAVRLQEKQKLRFNYGVTESQLVTYIKLAKKKKGATGEILLQLLEMRLDNIIFKFGIAPTIASARQLISHGHILINNERVNIPGYQCKVKDQISVSKKPNLRQLITKFFSESESRIIPSHLSFNESSLDGKINSIVSRESIALPLNELLIIEYYSRRV